MFDNLSPIPNLEGYFLDKDGNIYSIKHQSLKQLKSYVNKRNGYRYVGISHSNKKRTLRICRLMGKTYLNLTNDMTINHKNGIKSDDRLENLEVITLRENIIHGFKTGIINRKGSNHNQSILTEDIVLEIRKLYDQGMKIIELCKKFNLKYSHVEKLAKRRIWTHV